MIMVRDATIHEEKLSEWLVATRRDLHMYPELSNQERRTGEKIRAVLRKLGIEVYDLPGMTGLVGLIRGGGDGPTIALRADIDALPIQELNDVPYKSQHEGIMHACGHDVHMTIMLGVAKYIQESGLSKELTGNVKFLFQHAEERGTGAKEMIAHGVLEDPRVDRIFACHVSPEHPIGTVGVNRGQSHASADQFSLTIRGKGAHGARPNEGIDPIVAGSYFVTVIQTILSRTIKPTDAAVITVGRFAAGEAPNVIPEEAVLEGTMRALSNDVRDRVVEKIQEIVRGVETTFQVICDLRLLESVPACVNDEDAASFLYDVASHLLGPDNVRYIPPVTGSEDFAFFALERPGAIIRLGCGNREKGLVHPLHSPHFDVDEEVLMIGLSLFTEAIRRSLT